jgi:hypothetical protein
MDNVFKAQIRKDEGLLEREISEEDEDRKRLDNQPEWEEILDGVVQPGGTIPDMDGAFLDFLLIQLGY